MKNSDIVIVLSHTVRVVELEKISYKVILSVALGIMATISAFFSLEYDFELFQINLLWGHIFFIIVTMAWGFRYGFISLTAGLMFVVPIYLWPYNGFANIVPIGLLYLWVWFLSWGQISGQMLEGIYRRQTIYAGVTIILYIILFPILHQLNPILLGDSYGAIEVNRLITIIIKTVANEFIIVAICHSLLLIPSIRRIFKLPIYVASRYNVRIIFAITGISLFFAGVILFAIYHLVFAYQDFSWITTNKEVILVTIIMQLAFGIIGGGIAARFFQSRMQTKEDLRESYKKIQLLKEQLEQQVLIRTDQLQSAVQELESYVYTVSHDLKSPVRAIEGYCQLLFEDYKDVMPNDAKEMLENIHSISSDMILVMDKLLEYDTLSKKQMLQEEMDLGPMINRIVDEMKVASTRKDVTIIFNKELPKVTGDPVLFKMALYNIISNSFKFSKSRVPLVIIIDVWDIKTWKNDKLGAIVNDNEWIISIADNGVGFDANYTHKLFQLFERLHNKKEFQGSGVGLTTVKKVIERHGGKVWIEGQLHQGVTVYFTLQKKTG